MFNDDSAQAVDAGDAQTSDDEGQSYSVDLTEIATSKNVQSEETDTDEADGEEANTADKEEAKKWRISQKQWQEMKEMAKKAEGFEDFKSNLAKMLGVEEETITDSDSIMSKMQEQVETLKLENARAKWEAKHPAALNDDNRDAWEQIVKEKGNLVKQGLLEWDDLWKLARKDSSPSKTPSEYKEQELNVGSVPFASKGTPKSGSDSQVDDLLRQAGIPENLISEV